MFFFFLLIFKFDILDLLLNIKKGNSFVQRICMKETVYIK